MITATDFKVRFPEFASVDDARIELFINDAVIVLNESYWGDKYDLGLYYYTAHVLQLGSQTESGNADATSAIASQAVDGTSISFAQGPVNDQSEAFYSSTAYGQRYLALRKTLGIPASVI